jgi:hypothetical protein
MMIGNCWKKWGYIGLSLGIDGMNWINVRKAMRNHSYKLMVYSTPILKRKTAKKTGDMIYGIDLE